MPTTEPAMMIHVHVEVNPPPPPPPLAPLGVLPFPPPPLPPPPPLTGDKVPSALMMASGDGAEGAGAPRRTFTQQLPNPFVCELYEHAALVGSTMVGGQLAKATTVPPALWLLAMLPNTRFNGVVTNA